ncbi:aminotransferase class III-fold pyridoxal phosphate-dependent enzyme, partial [Geobacillus stearothermophilus]
GRESFLHDICFFLPRFAWWPRRASRTKVRNPRRGSFRNVTHKYFTHTGGNPIAMAAAKATLEVVFDPAFLQDVQEKGRYLLARLHDALASLDIVKDVRGLGLLVGIECQTDVAPLLPLIHENGLLVLSAGPSVIRLLPPLVVTKAEIDEAVDILTNVLNNANASAVL